MIIVSAGHYADKPGACFNGIYEYPETSVWAALIVGELQMRRIECALAPSARLGEKIAFINKQKNPLLAVEVHFNADVNHQGVGCETLYCPGSVLGEFAAAHVQASMAEIMLNDRGIKEGWYQLNPEFGVDRFLKSTRCPAIIIEPEFIHNFDSIFDARYLCSRAIVDGIVDYLEVMSDTVKCNF